MTVALITQAGISCNLGRLKTNSPSPTGTPGVVALASGTSAASSPVEGIFISQPGPNSRISSPVSVVGEADPSFEQNLIVRLTGEEGVTIAISPTTIQAPLGSRGEFLLMQDFTITKTQPGRISVYSTDAMTGAIEHLSSVEVQWLAGGSSQLASAVSEGESIDIEQPAIGAQISGGNLQVSGYSDYFFESSLGIVLCGVGAGAAGADVTAELCGGENNVLSTGTAMIHSEDVGLPGPFSGQLSYSVSTPTDARLIVYATSARDGGLLHVNSVAIQLLP